MILWIASFYKHVTKVVSYYWSSDFSAVSLRKLNQTPGVTGQCTSHPSVSLCRGIYLSHSPLEDGCDDWKERRSRRYSCTRSAVFVTCVLSLLICHRVQNDLIAVHMPTAQSLFQLPFFQSVLALDCDSQRLNHWHLLCCRSPPKKKKQSFNLAKSNIGW